MIKRILSLLLACTLMTALLPIGAYAHTEPADFANPFTDVDEGNRFYDAIMWAYTDGITTGKTDTTFVPDAICTRAQVVTFLWRAAGEPTPTTAVCPFTDVHEGTYYYQAVLWAVEQGITTGKTATTFAPTQAVKREQFVTFLWRAAGQPRVDVGSPFTDLRNTGAYYYTAVIWACKNGITNGTGDAKFGTGTDCTRAQTVMFLYRYYENKPVTAPAGIVLSTTSLTLNCEPFQLSGTVLPDNVPKPHITWTSADTTVATVSDDGTVIPVGIGTTTIAARCGSAVAYCTVTCEAAPAADPAKTALTIQIFGDSMSDNTWGDMQTWVDLLPNYLPEYDLTIINSAIGGSTLAEYTLPDGTKKGVAYQILPQTGRDPASELHADADLIIIWAGSNDWVSTPDLGTILDENSTTFYGAVQNIISYITGSTDAKLLFITPIQRNSASDRENRTETDMYGNRLNSRSCTLEQFAEAVKQTCSHYAIPCLDLYHTSGITQENILGNFAEDGLHINETGEMLVAEMIADMIRNPTAQRVPQPHIPAYDLSTFTDTATFEKFGNLVLDGKKVFLNKNLSGIKTAFTNGSVKLQYQLDIGGTVITVQSVGTAVYSKEMDVWNFTDVFTHEGATIQVSFTFKLYGLEATAIRKDGTT